MDGPPDVDAWPAAHELGRAGGPVAHEDIALAAIGVVGR
jgi:hypothetical protein